MNIKKLFRAGMGLWIILAVACTPAPPTAMSMAESMTPSAVPIPVLGCDGEPVDLQKYGGGDFRNPEEIVSKGKTLRATLEVKYAENQIASCIVNLRSYNGNLVGPTLRAKPGDRLEMIIKNMLPLNPPMDPQDILDHREFNTTNLHTHGLHVSPEEISDNVLRKMAPDPDSEGHHVIIDIPAKHPAGTFWYHPHVHGSTAIQVSSGMAGALIIEGGLDEVPAIKAAEEKILVLQQISYDTQGRIESFETSLGFQGGKSQWLNLHRQHTINGQLYPTLTMRPGEMQRWRLIHAGVEETIMATLYGPSKEELESIEIIKERILEEELKQIPLHEIAEDGLALGKIDDWQQIELQPGYRSDILVKLEKEGFYYLLDDSSDENTSLSGNVESEKPLARIHVQGEQMNMDLPDTAELAPLRPFPDIQDDEVTGYQSVVFCMCEAPDPQDPTHTKNKLVFTVNGNTFDEKRPPRLLKLNAVEEWEVSTDINSLAPFHPFHIHVNPFQFVRLGPDGKREIVWKDTLIIRQGTPQKLRMRYQDFHGTFVMHCHILGHEDQGMMEAVKIVP